MLTKSSDSSYRSNLAKQIILLVCLVGFAFSLLSSIFMTYKEIEDAKKRALNNFTNFEQAIEIPLEYALWQLDEGAVFKILESITKSPHVAQVSLEAPGVSKIELKSKFEPDWEIRSFPIYHQHEGKTEDLGVVTVTLSKQTFNQKLINSLIEKLLYLIAEYSLLCLVLFWIIHRKITEPILEIENEMEDFCQKHFAESDHDKSIPAEAKAISEISLLKKNIRYLQDRFLRAIEQQKSLDARKMAMELELIEEKEKLQRLHFFNIFGQFAAQVVHDFKNVLNIVSLKTYTLERTHEGLDKSKIAEDIQTSIDRATQTANKILSISKSKEKPVAFDVGKRILELETLLHAAIGRENKLILQLNIKQVNIVADAIGLDNAIINLCINARDAMPHGGEIKVTIDQVETQNEPELIIKIQDTGTGIPPEIKESIFEPFFSTKGPGKGFGLGLSQVKSFCEDTGGHLEYESHPGQTTFKMILPIA